MAPRKQLSSGLVVAAFATSLSLLPAVPASATVGTMFVGSDTTLSEDHHGDIVITADDISLDCAGRAVFAANAHAAILLENRSGVSIENCRMIDGNHGLLLIGSTGNTLAANSSTGAVFHGISLQAGSDHNTVTGNSASGGRPDSHDFVVWDSDENLLTGNSSAANTSAGPDIGNGFLLIGGADRNQVVENTSAGNGTGIHLSDSVLNEVIGNESTNHGVDGIHLSANADWNTVSENRVVGNRVGISTWRADDNTFSSNTITDNEQWGLLLNESSGNTVDENNASHNGITGLLVWAEPTRPAISAARNALTDNRVVGNGSFGVGVVGASHNNQVARNHVAANGHIGIDVAWGAWGNALFENQIVNNGQTGINLAGDTHGMSVIANVAAGNGINGIWVSGRNQRVVDNVASGHDADGTDGVYGTGIFLAFSNRGTVSGNETSQNYHGFRIELSEVNRVTLNVAERNHVGFDIVDSHNNTVSDNVAVRNGPRPGFDIREGSSRNDFQRNTAAHNQAGFTVHLGSTENFFAINNADHNSEHGFAIYNADANEFLENSASHNRLGFVIAGTSAHNIFEVNFGRNAWWDAADWTVDHLNSWSDNDFMKTTGL